MKATFYRSLLILTAVLFALSLNSCTQGGNTVVPGPNNDVEGNIDVSAVSDDYSDLGNKIWLDENNDGIKQRAESGFGNVVVRLYKDANKDGRPDGKVFQSDKTSSRGYYGFELLDPDINYVIEVVAPPGYAFSQKHASGAKNHDYDSDVNPGTGFTDTIDVKKGRYFYWYDAALHVADAPSNPAKVGNKVWLDANKDGIKQDSEAGVPNIKMNLWQDTTGNGKPDKKLRSDITSTKGYYKFIGLDHSKSYYVEIELPDNYKLSQRHNPSAPNSDKDSDFYVSSKFTDKLQLQEGKYSYWLADAAIYTTDTPPPPGDKCKDPVYIPDGVLRAALKKAAGGTLTCDSLEDVEILKANSKGSKITDLRGIQFAKYMSKLYLNDNAISNLAPLAKLRELEVLHLANNNITNISALKNLTNLENLNLANNQIINISALEKLKNLITLKLYGNEITEINPLRRMKDLENLYLGYNSKAKGNKVKDIATLKRLESLEVAELSFNNISNITALLNLDELTRVSLQVNCLDTSHSSDDYKNIQRLKNRGVKVSYANQRVSCDSPPPPPPPPGKPASVGDFVWEDANKDGIYQSTEKALANITLNLWQDTTGNGRPDKKIETHKTNSEGRQTFYNLDITKNYYVEIVLPIDYRLSQKHNPNAGNSNLDSDFDPQTRFTDKLILKSDTFHADLADAAVYKDSSPPPPPAGGKASLGSKVWFDENRDGIKQRSEGGIKDVTVSLFVDTNNDRIPDKYLASKITDERGRYQFEDLDVSKRYYVTILMPDDRGFTGYHSSNAPNDEGLPGSDWDNDIDPKTGFTHTITLLPDRYNYWVADIGLKVHSYRYQIRIYGNGVVSNTRYKSLCYQWGGKCVGDTNDTLKAIPADGWEFYQWKVSRHPPDNPYNPVYGVMGSGNTRIRAIFADTSKTVWKADISGHLPQWSPDGKKIAFRENEDDGNRVLILDAKTGSVLRTITNKKGFSLQWNKSGSKLAIDGYDSTHNGLSIYSAETGSKLSSFSTEGWIGSFAWHPDESIVAITETIKGERSVRIQLLRFYDAETGQIVKEVAELRRYRHHGHSYQLKWSPDGKYLAAVYGVSRSRYRSLKVWRVKSNGDATLIINGLSDQSIKRGGPFDWSDDSKYIYVVGYNNNHDRQEFVKVSVPSNNIQTVLPYDSYTIYMKLSPNKKYASNHGSSDEFAEVRRISDWKLIDKFVRGSDVAWSPRGDQILVVDEYKKCLRLVKIDGVR